MAASVMCWISTPSKPDHLDYVETEILLNLLVDGGEAEALTAAVLNDDKFQFQKKSARLCLQQKHRTKMSSSISGPRQPTS